MACPNCGSGNVRAGESGFLFDNYYCLNCDRPFEGISRVVKGVAVGALCAAVLGPAGFLAGAAMLDGDGGEAM